MGYKTDIEIAQECEMKPITEIAAKAVDEGKVSDKKRIADNFLYACTGDGGISGGYPAGR